MSKNKYENILGILDDNYCVGYVSYFSEDKIKLLEKLENDNITATFTNEEWDKICVILNGIPDPAIFIATIMSPNLPKEYFKKIYPLTDEETEILLLFSDNVPEDIIKTVLLDYDTEIIEELEMHSDFISQKVIRYMCKNLDEVELKTINYEPFKYIKQENKFSEIIPEMIKNENNKYFKGDVPESFLNAIINNKNLHEEIRMQAFDVGYNPNYITNTTPLIRNELYKLYADVICEIGTTTETKDVVNASYTKIHDWMSSGMLSSNCQLDFINRMIKTIPNDRQLELLENIAEKTRDPVVLISMFDINHLSIPDFVLKNRFMLKDEVFQKLVTKKLAKDMIKPFMLSAFMYDHNIRLITEYLKLDDFYINLALVTSLKGNCDTFVMTQTTNEDELKKLSYIHSLKMTADLLSFPNSQKVVAYATSLLVREFNDENDKNKHRWELNSILQAFYPDLWFSLTKEEYTYLNTWLENADPAFDNINKALKEKLDNTYNFSQIVNKYPTVFQTKKINKPSEIESFCDLLTHSDIPCSIIDGDEIFNLTTGELNQFTKDIKNIDNEIFYKNIRDAILETCELSYMEEQNSLFKKIYKLTDLFNICHNKVAELELKEYEEYDKEI